MYIDSGCYARVIIPDKNGIVDLEELERKIGFLVSEGVAGVFIDNANKLSAVTDGGYDNIKKEREAYKEYESLLRKCVDYTSKKNNLYSQETDIFGKAGFVCQTQAVDRTRRLQEAGCDGVVLYSIKYFSVHILHRKNSDYYEEIGRKSPLLKIVIYEPSEKSAVSLSPQNVKEIEKKATNVCGIIYENGKVCSPNAIREKCRPDFAVFCKDDQGMINVKSFAETGKRGVFSVFANIVPGAMEKIANCSETRDTREAERVSKAMKPLFSVVGTGEVETATKNTVKAMMELLRMGHYSVLEEMDPKRISEIKNALSSVYRNNPWLLEPLAKFYDVDIEKALSE